MNLTEASIQRFKKHLDDKLPMLFISPCRNSSSTDKEVIQANNRRIQDLKNILHSYHYGYNKIRGGWVEDEFGTVEEDSFLVYASIDEEDNLLKLGFDLVRKFNQDAAIFIDSTGTGFMINQNHEKQPIGTNLNLSDIEDYYTKIGNTKFKLEDLEQDTQPIYDNHLHYQSVKLNRNKLKEKQIELIQEDITLLPELNKKLNNYLKEVLKLQDDLKELKDLTDKINLKEEHFKDIKDNLIDATYSLNDLDDLILDTYIINKLIKTENKSDKEIYETKYKER